MTYSHQGIMNASPHFSAVFIGYCFCSGPGDSACMSWYTALLMVQEHHTFLRVSIGRCWRSLLSAFVGYNNIHCPDLSTINVVWPHISICYVVDLGLAASVWRLCLHSSPSSRSWSHSYNNYQASM